MKYPIPQAFYRCVWCSGERPAEDIIWWNAVDKDGKAIPMSYHSSIDVLQNPMPPGWYCDRCIRLWEPESLASRGPKLSEVVGNANI